MPSPFSLTLGTEVRLDDGALPVSTARKIRVHGRHEDTMLSRSVLFVRHTGMPDWGGGLLDGGAGAGLREIDITAAASTAFRVWSPSHNAGWAWEVKVVPLHAQTATASSIYSPLFFTLANRSFVVRVVSTADRRSVSHERNRMKALSIGPVFD